jgi:ABC-type lipoprotein release transport system permease subunit
MFRIRRLAGRDFTWDDNASARPVAIVTESFARQLFREIDAVGRRVRIVSGAKTIELEIVGVVENAPVGNLREPHVAVAFRPLLQDLTRAQAAIAHVRVRGDSTALRNAYVRAVEAEGQHFVRAVFRLDEWIDNALLQERLLAGVAISGAALVVLVACVGLYGLLAYGVVARVREIGIRMSLGATRRTILRMIIGQSLKLAAPGVLIGMVIAAAGARLLRSQLYGISPSDPSTLIGSATIVFVVAVAAGLNPAWRASRVEPIDAVRQE